MLRIKERLRRKGPKEEKKPSEKKPRMERKPAEKAKIRLKQRQPSETRKRKPVRESQSETIKKRLKEKQAKKGDARTKSRVKDSKRRTEKSKTGKQRNEGEKAKSAPVTRMRNPAKQGETTKSKEHERLGTKNEFQYPRVNGKTIKSHEKLDALLNGEYSGLKTKSGFKKLKEHAHAHLDMIDHYKGKEYLEYGDVGKWGRKLGVDDETVRKWAGGTTPRLYYFMNRAITRSEANRLVDDLIRNNGGVKDAAEVRRRLDNYYMADDERNAKSRGSDMKDVQRYCGFLKRVRLGGNIQDMARESNLSESEPRDYLDGGKPWLCRLAGQIPAERPGKNKKWLPLESDKARNKGNFIPVVERIKTHKDVIKAIEKTRPLDNADMKRFTAKFGQIDRQDAFMYLLGFYVGDGGARNRTRGALSAITQLSRKYGWSKDAGDAFCYYAGLLGIDSNRLQNVPKGTTTIRTDGEYRTIRRHGKRKWATESSPLLVWIHRSCLGLDDSAKSHQKISADWIKTAPYDLRKAFLEGWYDSDGSASLKGRYVCLSTTQNQEFAQELIESFGVKTRIPGDDVVTKGYDEARKMAEINPFRHAESRLNACKRLTKMLDSRRSVRKKPLQEEEREYIGKLGAQGMSAWDISQRFLDDRSDFIDERVIQRILDITSNESQ